MVIITPSYHYIDNTSDGRCIRGVAMSVYITQYIEGYSDDGTVFASAEKQLQGKPSPFPSRLKFGTLL